MTLRKASQSALQSALFWLTVAGSAAALTACGGGTETPGSAEDGDFSLGEEPNASPGTSGGNSQINNGSQNSNGFTGNTAPGNNNAPGNTAGSTDGSPAGGNAANGGNTPNNAGNVGGQNGGNPGSGGETGPEPPPLGTPKVAPVVNFQCDLPEAHGYRGVRLLTRLQYQRSIEDLLQVDFDVTPDLPGDTKTGSFINNASLSVLDGAYITYVTAAERVAKWSADRNFAPTVFCGNFDQQCGERFVNEFAPKLFRRPLTEEEAQAYRDVATGSKTNGDVKTGMQVALSAMLSSPQFLYRSEIGEPAQGMGDGVFQLTQYEMATFLSYTFTNSTPNQNLLDAARNNTLNTPEQLRSHAARLLDSDRSRLAFEEVIHDWLSTDKLESATKDDALFPGFNGLLPHMKEELSLFFRDVMLDHGASFSDLFTPGFTYVNTPLAQHYGVQGGAGNDFQKVQTPGRGGLLLSGAFMTRWAHPDDTNPITRSVHVRRNLLCDDVPDPPEGVDVGRKAATEDITEFLNATTTTNRARVDALTKEPLCAVCHAEVINPLGFGLENWDAVGRPRTVDSNGNPIDAEGELHIFQSEGVSRGQVPFQGAEGLAEVLASDPAVSTISKACLARQMMSLANGVDWRSMTQTKRPQLPKLPDGEHASYSCDMQALVQVLNSESPRAMLETLPTLSSVRYRKTWVRE